MKDLLNNITSKTRIMWYELNKKYGDHTYSLCVNGLGEVELTKGYTHVIAKGTNRDVQRKIKELLNK